MCIGSQAFNSQQLVNQSEVIKLLFLHICNLNYNLKAHFATTEQL